MLLRAIADIVVFIHFLWILFLILGAWWGRKHRAIRYVHAAGLLFAVISQVAGWYCPLTYLEAWLRQQQDPGLAGPGSFIARYAERLIYLEVSPASIFALTIALVVFHLWLYRKTLFRGRL